MPSSPIRSWNDRLGKWQKAARGAALPDGATRFFARTEISSPALQRRLYEPDFHAGVNERRPYAALRDEYFPLLDDISSHGIEQFLFADLTLSLPDRMLTKVDRVTMAHSLEARVPFLSHKLVEWALTVPIGLKLKGGAGKYIVRKAVEPWLPPGILDRGKQGFQMPLAQWFAGDFGRFAESLWRDSGAAQAGYLNPGRVEKLFREHRKGHRDHSRLLYAMAMFALWWSTDRQPLRASPILREPLHSTM